MEPETTETTAPVTQAAPAGKLFTEEDMNRARQEERDKLYGKLSQTDDRVKHMADEVAKLSMDRDAKAAEAAALKQAEADAAKAQRESEMDAKALISEREKEWDHKLSEMQNQWAAKEAAWGKEAEHARVANYTAQRISQLGDDIAPELLHFIKGNNEQEVEASIATAIATTNAIVGKMQETIEQTLAAQQQQAIAQRPGVSPTGYTAAGPLDAQGGTQTYSAEDINNMTLDEYREKLRPRMGFGNSQGKGMFG